MSLRGLVTLVIVLALTIGDTLLIAEAQIGKVSHVGVVVPGSSSSFAPRVVAFRQGLRDLGYVERQNLVVHVTPARDLIEIEAAFSTMAATGTGAVVVLDDGVFVHHRTRMASLALQKRLPMVNALRELAEAGGLMAYGPSLTSLARRAATFVDRILKGAKPADLPVEQPTTFELVINLKTAKVLGLTIPQSVLVRADEVIQ